ncbi:MAG TPA: hypothetical protein VIM11_12330 [Tepidisphaeraceae bacterium]|jgi:hypothetical protein
MELEEAVKRISIIHRGIVRAQIFHGYRAVPTFLSGLMAFVACAVQGIWLDGDEDDVPACLILWVSAAAISVAIVAMEMFIRYKRSSSTLERDMTIGSAEQFIPTLAAGALLTFVFWQFVPHELLWLLPGLWAVMLSMGIFASRKMLPPAATLVGAHYLITGLLCIALGQDKSFFPAWTMALTFGAGQFLAAAILYFSLERKPRGGAVPPPTATVGGTQSAKRTGIV